MGTAAHCFVMGVIVDIFSDTSGIATVSMTLIGFVRPYILMPLLSREAEEDMAPTMETWARRASSITL